MKCVILLIINICVVLITTAQLFDVGVKISNETVDEIILDRSRWTEPTVFTLSNSQITNLNRNIFPLTPLLHKVVFHSNKFDTLPDLLLSNFTHLTIVYIIDCNLESVPENLFKNSFNLYDLSLRENLLTTLPDFFLANQNRLAYVNLSGNKFTTFANNFFINILTKPMWGSGRFYFFFMRNKIENLNRNQISYLSQFNAYFDFRQNAITDLSVLDVLANGVKHDNFIVFEKNPIDCTCETIQAFKRYAAITSGYRRHINRTLCATPSNLKGTAVINVDCS